MHIEIPNIFTLTVYGVHNHGHGYRQFPRDPISLDMLDIA